MRKSLFSLLIALCVWIASAQAGFAYSYGKPDEEPIAEAYKKAAAALEKQPPDYQTALEELAKVKKEMSEHAEIGPELAKEIETSLKEQKKEDALHYWRQALVRNIERRLNNVAKDFTNYADNKILLAKANSTFKALSLHLQQKDPELVQKLEKDFQDALTSLGNPGLFGVGKKEPNRPLFDKAKESIVQNLHKIYFPEGEKALGGGTGHLKAEESSGIQAGSENPLGKWLPLIVILLTLIGAVVIFQWLGRRKKADK